MRQRPCCPKVALITELVVHKTYALGKKQHIRRVISFFRKYQATPRKAIKRLKQLSARAELQGLDARRKDRSVEDLAAIESVAA